VLHYISVNFPELFLDSLLPDGSDALISDSSIFPPSPVVGNRRNYIKKM
jgi:hypothetical protein